MWQPWLKARMEVGEAGQTDGMSRVSESQYCVNWNSSAECPVPWVWRSQRKDWMRKGWVCLWAEKPLLFGSDWDLISVLGCQIGPITGQFQVLGEFKMNALIKTQRGLRSWPQNWHNLYYAQGRSYSVIDFPEMGSYPPLLSPCFFVGRFNPMFSAVQSIINMETYLCVNKKFINSLQPGLEDEQLPLTEFLPIGAPWKQQQSCLFSSV